MDTDDLAGASISEYGRMKLLLAIVAAATSLTSLVVAQNCSASFSKIDTSSLTSFTAVQLGRDCASGSTLTLEAPGAVSWTFVEVEGLAAPEIYESSSGLVVPFVSSDGTLRFE